MIESSLTRRRRTSNAAAMSLIVGALLATLLPLFAVLGYTVYKGISGISWEFLTHSMNGVGPLDSNGGAYHAIVGTLEQVLIAFLIAVPFGIVVGVYLVEVGRGKLASVVRMCIDVMTGVPSIVAGLFIFSFWVIGLGMGFSGFAAGISLAILMLPTVVRSTEEMLKLVPNDLREASYALGVSRWRTVFSVIIPAAASGITTGVVLGLARITGETAPLLLTAFGFDAIRNSPVDGPQSSLPLFVFSQAGSAFDVAIQRAWTGALVLIVIVMVLIAIARLLSRGNRLSVE